MTKILDLNPKLKSLILKDHDSSYGGYKVKYVGVIEIGSLEFKALVKRDKGNLGSLVGLVNNMLYTLVKGPFHNPTVGGIHDRAKKGVKTLTFTYFSNDVSLAQCFGMETIPTKEGLIPKWNAQVNLLGAVKVSATTKLNAVIVESKGADALKRLYG